MAIQKTVVVGAGPVGCLAAIYAASRGDDVEVYELRGDLRDPSVTPLNFTRSINLALSERGINSIRHAHRPGLLECVLENTIPMHGRMIHGKSPDDDLTEISQQYDIHGRFIRAADRGELNMNLLDELEDMPNVQFFFNHKLVGADFRKNVAWFEHCDSSSYGKTTHTSEVEVKFDFMIGADGAHSAVRYHLMKFARLNYQQEYIDTLWCEFLIPPKINESQNESDFQLSPNHLHIWPGGSFMFIAIPSTDKSFTSTLFLSASKFAELDTSSDDAVVGFFEQNFPGVVPDLISAEDLIEQYTTNPHLPLISIKCHPYHYASSAVILGDAAHAMVPFYGQGMNAGLESVRVLFNHLDRHLPHPATSPISKSERAKLRAAALAEYTAQRHPDAETICDLAYANYAEMSSHVQSRLYLLRKAVEEQLSNWLPWLGWATQYSRVSFGNERYSEVHRLARHQQTVLTRAGLVMFGGSVGFAAFMTVRFSHKANVGFGNFWERIAALWPSR